MSRSGDWGPTGAEYIHLRGRLLPVKDELQDPEDSDGDSDGPDDSDPEFLDADEIEAGAMQVKNWRIPSSRVKIKTEDSREYIVNGSFPLIDPWWTVSVTVKEYKSHQYYAKGPPSYELDDNSLGEATMLPLFLNECGVHEEYRKDFMDWLPHFPPVSFSTLKELANDFKEEENKDILPYLEKSSSGAIAFLALNIPLVMKYLPKLLPSKIISFFMLDVNEEKNSGECPSDILQRIEQMLTEDPWKLGFGAIIYRELHICGCEATWESFQQCEDLLVKIPSLQTNALIIYTELKKKCMELGDTYVDRSELTKAVTKAQDMSDEDAWEALQFLKEHKIVMNEQERVFLYNWYWYELDVANCIRELVLRKPLNLNIIENDIFGSNQSPREQQKQSTDNQESSHGQNVAHCPGIEESEEKIKMLQLSERTTDTEQKCATRLDAEQRKAVTMILENPVTVISGKGGCGKTTVVSLVFKSMMNKETDEVEQACKAFEEDLDASEEWFVNSMSSGTDHNGPVRILLTAPTGKAASLLKKKTGLPAATLHQVTCSYSAWKKLKNDELKWKFSQVEALVVDEASLVSVRMFSAVLKLLCSYGKLSKLVILGDVRQLPSIEPGNMLADVFCALGRLNWAIELKTNHRAESQLIVDNATRISHQGSVEFDSLVYINGHSCSEMPSVDKKFILVSLAREVDLSAAIQKLLKDGPGLEDDKHSQFISFRRKDCLLINDQCCRHYAGHTIKNLKSKLEFRCGDKVCCTKNAYVKDLLSKPRDCAKESDKAGLNGIVTISQHQLGESGLPLETGVHKAEDHSMKEIDDERLCNGEIFFVTNDVDRDRIRELTLSDGEDREYTLNYKALRSRSGLQHAWARTIHTFQGSEEDTVVYVLGTAGRQNWKHVYTAVTRGRKRVYVIASKDQLEKAIGNKARARKTRLKQRLKDKLPQSRTFAEQTANPSAYPESSQAAGEPVASGLPPYTQLKSPLRISHPHVPTTPEAGSCTTRSERPEHGDHVMRTPPGRLQDCVLEESPSQKRTRGPVNESETPRKIRANPIKDWTEESPTNSRSLQRLSLHSPCPKKLFEDS